MNGEVDLAKTIANIHTVARHLFDVPPDSEDVVVSVTPVTMGWKVRVRLGSALRLDAFELVKGAAELGDALTDTLRALVSMVSERLERDGQLVAQLT